MGTVGEFEKTYGWNHGFYSPFRGYRPPARPPPAAWTPAILLAILRVPPVLTSRVPPPPQWRPPPQWPRPRPPRHPGVLRGSGWGLAVDVWWNRSDGDDGVRGPLPVAVRRCYVFVFARRQEVSQFSWDRRFWGVAQFRRLARQPRKKKTIWWQDQL